ncbi:MAG: phosphatidylglycerophosphatase A [Deltaproteobacteria bacterium]|nr:phosphatidylglycerophosphatase A [Deltaproteobacteria bacterium]
MLRQRIATAIATAGGAGYSPIAPGTCGTLLTIPLAWWCRDLGTLPYLALVAAVFIVGVWAAGVANETWGTHDSGRIVVDEVAGYLMTVAFVDRSNAWALAAGFVVFRYLDIAKPIGIRWLDKNVKGGFGVMFDDLVAGVAGAIALALLVWVGVL